MKQILTLSLVLGFSATASAQEAGKIDFVKQILPIWEKSCMECHQETYTDENGRTKKPKGGLRMDTAELASKGGEDAEGVAAGKPDESAIYTRTLLPRDDDDAMPPDGKGEPLTKEQQELLKQWIAEGANYGDWKEWDKAKAKAK